MNKCIIFNVNMDGKGRGRFGIYDRGICVFKCYILIDECFVFC